MITSANNLKPVIFTSNGTAKQAFVDGAAVAPVSAINSTANQKDLTAGAVLLGGSLAGPAAGAIIDAAVTPKGPIIKLVDYLSNKTPGLDRWIDSLKTSQKLDNLFAPVSKRIAGKNLNLFMEGYKSNNTMGKAKSVLLKAAQGSEEAVLAQQTIDTLDKIKNAGILGKTAGTLGVFLKNNLYGVQGLFNGLFAAVTVNNVLKAKEGEKFSTFMEDVLGNWIGSIGGFKLAHSLIFGLEKVAASGETSTIKTIAEKICKMKGKTLIIPLTGAFLAGHILKSISHALFGTPTHNNNKPQQEEKPEQA